MILSFKKCGCLLLAAALALSTAACGLSLPEKKPESKTETSGTPSMVLVSDLSPKETVDKAFDAMIKLDADTFKKYLYNDGKGNQEKDRTGREDDDKEGRKIIASLLSKFSYKVISSSEQGDSATVKVQITNRDLSGTLKQLIAAGVKEKVDDSTLVDLINKTDKTKQFDVDIKLKYQDDQWKIDMTQDLLNAIAGDFVPGLDFLNHDKVGWRLD